MERKRLTTNAGTLPSLKADQACGTGAADALGIPLSEVTTG